MMERLRLRSFNKPGENMLVTCHWSATPPPNRLRDYHVEFARTKEIDAALIQRLLAGETPSDDDWATIVQTFAVFKNFDLDTATAYGTWHLNHDPRDHTSNIEVGALCMSGEGVGTTSWGAEPFTIVHAWMMAAIVARICAIKKIDTAESFPAAPYQLANGPIYTVSTHAERALQTPDSDATLRPTFGYFIFSGDPDSRWDLAALDSSRAVNLKTPEGARSSAIASANWIRMQAHALKAIGISDFWQLDKEPT
jgi:hypothetical protein